MVAVAFRHSKVAALNETRARLLRVIQGRFNLENSVSLDLSLQLGPRHDEAVSMLVEVLAQEQALTRPSTIAQLQRTVSTVLSNLLRAFAVGQGAFVAVPLGPQYYTTNSRYNVQRIGYDNLRRVIDFLEGQRLISRFPGFRNPVSGYSRSTRIIATSELLSLFHRDSDALAIEAVFDTYHSPNLECLLLRDPKKHPIEYDDTSETLQMRERLKAWNSFLERQWTDLWSTDDEFKSLPCLPGDLETGDTPKRRVAGVDLSRRRLYRIFNNASFAEGGRFYGGWWQQIPSAWRSHVTINGYPCRELDYSNFQPAMLYAIAGERLEGYAYDIDGLDHTDRNKEAVKRTLFKLIYSGPGQSIRPLTNEELPEGWTWKKLLQAVQDRHAPIKTFLRSGVATKMQRRDSDIAEDVMLSMMKRNILVLPVHDSFLVRSGHYLALRDEMLRAYQDAMKSDIKIKLDLSYLDRQPSPIDPTQAVVSKLEDFDAILKAEKTKEEGPYRGYFMRERLFRAMQSPEYFERFEPY